MHYYKKIFIVCISLSVGICGCSTSKGTQNKEFPTTKGDSIISEDATSKNSDPNSIAYETKETKSYDLPITDDEKQIILSDCEDIVTDANSNNLSYLEVLKMQDRIVVLDKYKTNIFNHEKMLDKITAFLETGESTQIVYYQTSGRVLIRRELFFENNELYETTCYYEKDYDSNRTTTNFSKAKAKSWNLTDKKWVIYELHIPDGPEITEVIQSISMLKLAPVNEEYQLLTEQYLYAIGYHDNNLFSTTWNADNFAEVELNRLFSHFYVLKHGVQPDYSSYTDGINKEDFESLVMEFLPITKAQIQASAIVNENSQKYLTDKALGNGRYNSGISSSSIPEITYIDSKPDGTIDIHIDAACEILGTDRLASHILNISIDEYGAVKYLSNTLVNQ